MIVMAKVTFTIDTILKDGYHRAGTTIELPAEVARDLARLTGVDIVELGEPVAEEKPKKKRRGRPAKK